MRPPARRPQSSFPHQRYERRGTIYFGLVPVPLFPEPGFPDPLFFAPLVLLSAEESSALTSEGMLTETGLLDVEAESGDTPMRMEAYEMPGTALSARASSGRLGSASLRTR